jgi:holo-[acyl-carrier protein] synthase
VILGIGIDVVKVERMAAWVDNPGLARRFFSADELSLLPTERLARLEYLAARFAAKEAFGKALGTGLRGIALSEIAVRKAPSGQPEYALSGKCKEMFIQRGGKSAHLSLSHDGGVSVAVAIIEG